jgi:transposase-like protein
MTNNTPLTPEQKTTYLSFKGLRCPFCGAKNIFANDTEAPILDTFYQNVECERCHRQWTDTYTFTDVTDRI